MIVAEYIADFLVKKKITHIFELSGGMITYLLDEIYKTQKIDIITMHHEQGASFAADGYARVKRLPGIALATSGPGATNLLTAMGSCYYDSVPAIFITGQVNTHELKGNRNIRQLGFQETDIVSMASPITKYCVQITHADEIEVELNKAFEIAMQSRQGPVLIDIPMNIQRSEIILKNFVSQKTKEPTEFKQLQELLNEIEKSSRPLILSGRGVVATDAAEVLKKVSEKFNIPVVSTLLGLGSMGYHHPNFAGFIGSYGNRWANISLGTCDLLIVVGARLDIRQTGADVEGFSKDKKIFHIDIEPAEINNRVKNSIPIVGDVKEFLSALNKVTATISKDDIWKKNIEKLKGTWSDLDELKDCVGINPNVMMHKVSQHSKQAGSFLADVGSHQMWAAQSLEIDEDQFFITSGGMGAMGFALPASIGACLASGKPSVCICGDGGFQLNIQELQTIVRNKLPIKIVVMNNNSLGMIRQFQDSYFDGRHQSTVWGYSAPDFEKIAVAYGIKAITIKDESNMDYALEAMWANANEPFLMQVMIDNKTNVYPKIAFGKPITEMEPLSLPNAIEST